MNRRCSDKEDKLYYDRRKKLIGCKAVARIHRSRSVFVCNS